MTPTPTAAARVSGTIDERKLHDLWTMGNCRMPFGDFKARILAAIQPDHEPQPVACDPHRYAVVSADYSRPFLLGAYPELGNAVKAQCGSPKKWHIFERLYATPSSAGTVSVEAVSKMIDSLAPTVASHAQMQAALRALVGKSGQ